MEYTYDEVIANKTIHGPAFLRCICADEHRAVFARAVDDGWEARTRKDIVILPQDVKIETTIYMRTQHEKPGH